MDRYKYYRNKILTLTRLSKKLYFDNYFQLNMNNIKKTWQGINDLINRKKNRRVKNALRRSDNQRLSHDSREHSNILNTHFATIGQKLASKIPASKKQFTDYLPITGYGGSFVFEPIHPSEIEL